MSSTFSQPGSINKDGDTVILAMSSYAGATIQVADTFAGTVTFKVTSDGQNYQTIYGDPVGGAASAGATTTGGVWRFSVAGMLGLMAVGSGWASGSARITIRATLAGNGATGTTGVVTGPVSIADGADVAEGSLADPKVIGDNPGTINAHLRGIDYLLNEYVDTVNHRANVNLTNTSIAVTSGTLATAAKQDTGNTALASIDGKTPALGQALAAASVPVVLTSAQLSTLTPLAAITATGPTASGASLTANPLTTGALARTSPPTAVANAQVVNLQASLYGELIVRHALRETKGSQQTQISSSTAETTIITADGTYKLDLYGLVITNTSATFTKVTIKDSSAGTTRLVFSIPPQETRGFMLPACDAHKQNAANNNWTATCGTSVAAIEISALFVQNL